ncbi:hypothetical protein DHEL01_v211239 [Diaporthe helianthi]|uniref:Rhodopsin domain-containing protein n=1 Tax=Diaporthe helianthi TaxID=158607 RepID=A0A2P5HJC6_DIAHE|nr:hypothetical protein DHEL01_v211239 [Diaporthe helianthi]
MSLLTGQLPTQLPPEEDHRVALEAVWWAFFSVATVFIGLRFWARSLHRSLGWDDFSMSITYILFLTEAILITYVAETGRTTHLILIGAAGGMEKIYSTLMWYIIILDVGIFLTGLGKIAIGITILRMLGRTSLWQRCVVWTVMFLTIATCFIDFGISTFRCGDPKITWTLELQAAATCVSTQAQSDINLFSNIVQVVADFAFSILPMVIVSGLRMPRPRKTVLMMGLGLTLFTGVAGSVKTYYAATFDEMDLTWNIFPNLVWFALEAMLIISCVRTLRDDEGSQKTQQDPPSFEMPRLEYYPQPAPPAAHGYPHDPNMQQHYPNGRIQVMDEYNVSSHPDPRFGPNNA